jgi:tryptophan-rich sensory protein
MDTIGQILWFAMFFTPVVTVPLVWKYNTSNTKAMRIIIGLLIAFLLSFVFFIISIKIHFRNGLAGVNTDPHSFLASHHNVFTGQERHFEQTQ